MAWLCTMMSPLAPHADRLATAAFVAVGIVGLIHFLGVLPAHYAYQRRVYGPQAALQLNWIANRDLRAAGLGWAIVFRRVSMLVLLLLFTPVVVLPTACS